MKHLTVLLTVATLVAANLEAGGSLAFEAPERSAETRESSTHPQGFKVNMTCSENEEFEFKDPPEVGHWAVYDTAETVTDSQDSPCCMLAKMKAEVAVKLRSGFEKLFNLPPSARSLNNTCTNKGFETQRLNLTWSKGHEKNIDPSPLDASLGLSFDTESHYEKNGTLPWTIVPGAHFLSGIFFDVPVNLSENALAELEIGDGPSSTRQQFKAFRVRADVRGLRLFEAPKLFAYSCKKGVVKLIVPAAVTVNGKAANVQVDAQMTLTHLQLEPFRKERFYTDFTHLKFDCIAGWPYGNVVEMVNGALGGFVVVTLIAMTFRARRLREKAKEQGNVLNDANVEKTP